MKKQIKAVDARGRKLGGDTPLLCAPLVGRTRARLLAEATRVLKQKPDLVEWRVDFFDAIGDAGAVVEAARALRAVVGQRPVVFTSRAESGGGERIALGREAIVALYDAVAASGLVDFVDFELDNDPAHVRRVRESTRRHDVRLILSYHNLAYTPGSHNQAEPGIHRLTLSRRGKWPSEDEVRIVKRELREALKRNGRFAETIYVEGWLKGPQAKRPSDQVMYHVLFWRELVQASML